MPRLKKSKPPRSNLASAISSLRWPIPPTLTKIIFVFSLAGCAARAPVKVDLPLRDQQWLPAKNAKRECRVKAHLELATVEQTVRGDVEWLYKLNGKNSTWLVRFLTPFGNTAAELDLGPGKKNWSDPEGDRPLATNPLFALWYREDWWKEVAFLHSYYVRPATKATLITQSQSGTVTARSSEHRIWTCEDKVARENASAKPGRFVRVCKLESGETGSAATADASQQVSGEIDFSLIECSPTL